MSEAEQTAGISEAGGEAASVLEIGKAGAVTVITMMHRPHNLLGPALMGPLVQAFRNAVAGGSRAVVLRSGLRNFCAGADVS